eukprot:4272763-Lingulodinium_polyedra.AAC.1
MLARRSPGPPSSCGAPSAAPYDRRSVWPTRARRPPIGYFLQEQPGAIRHYGWVCQEVGFSGREAVHPAASQHVA